MEFADDTRRARRRDAPAALNMPGIVALCLGLSACSGTFTDQPLDGSVPQDSSTVERDAPAGDGSSERDAFVSRDSGVDTSSGDANAGADSALDAAGVSPRLAALRDLFDRYLADSRDDWDTWGERYNGTSGGGYHTFHGVEGLIHMWEQTRDDRYLQEALDVVFNYIDQGVDMEGNAVHTQNYYPRNGYLDWVWDRTDERPGHINHFHQEWRAGASAALVLHAFKQHGGAGLEPANADGLLFEFIEVHVWDKYSLDVSAPNTPPVIDSRNLENSVGTDQVSRLATISLIMDEYSEERGNNRYHDHHRRKLTALAAEIVENGGFPGQWTDPDAYSGSDTIDVSHASDTFAALNLSVRLGYDYVSPELLRLVGDNIENNLYPAADSDSTWTPEADGEHEGLWPDHVGRNWGSWAAFIRPGALERHVDDYLENAPVTGFGSEAEMGMVGNLYAALVAASR